MEKDKKDVCKNKKCKWRAKQCPIRTKLDAFKRSRNHEPNGHKILGFRGRKKIKPYEDGASTTMSREKILIDEIETTSTYVYK